MRLAPLARLALVSTLAAFSACGGGDDDPAAAPAASTPVYYQTKTPYVAPAAGTSYEAPPAGYQPVYTQMVARHGSRGLSSLKYDLTIYNLWKQAQTEGALTELGAKLGPDVLKIMKANFLLGYGVAGISKPGYGNETQVGITEHTQLATRLLARQSALFTAAGAAATSAPRQIVAVTSGQDRAVDSGAFFVASLRSAQANLASLIVTPPAPAGYPAGAPVAQPAGTNRFLLYFHKLVPATDRVTNAADPLYATYQASQAFQAYANDADQAAAQAAIAADPAAQTAGRTALERLFTKAFVDKLAAGSIGFANTGTMSFTSDDGKFTSSLTGDGKTTIKTLADGGALLYELYCIAPAMTQEAGVDFTPYLPPEQAQVFAAFNDASDFYSKGPGLAEKGDVTWRMAQILEDDFFDEVDRIAKGDLARVAKLRFTHAEIMIPFATKMGLKSATQQQPKATPYSYANNPWRGDAVSPMAANLQWDVARDGAGRVIVKMLYNEREIDFKPACDGARLASASRWYDYTGLKTCHGHVAAP